MTTTLALPTEPKAPDVISEPFDEWKQEGEKRCLRLQANEDQCEQSQWDIGDWILEGVEEFGKQKAYDAAARITNHTHSYLQTVVWVVNRFRDPSLRKETKLKWSHFKELAYIKDDQHREQLLTEFNDGRPNISVRDVRERVDAELKKLGGEGRKRTKKDHTHKKFVTVEVPMSRKFRNDIRSLAEAVDKAMSEVLLEILETYLPDYMKKFEHKIRNAKATSKAVR